jgi:hypothetical protein
MHLPSSNSLPVAKLAASFGNTSATYKFYWLLGVIELIEEGHTTIPKRQLFARMIGNAWYTVNYFHVSFGKQDLIQQAVHTILEQEQLTRDTKKSTLLTVLEESPLKSIEQTLWHFNKNVPHWFLSPWFPKVGGENDVAYRKRIYSSSQAFENNCLYALYEDHIVVNPNWVDYLKANAKILKDFIYWNLTLFLQTRNPNVPDIANKLIRPPFRGSLTNQRRNYWDIVFKELGTVDCIFTNRALTIDRYALDHFIPHAFVSHDLIWNLLPIDTSFNATKSDKLPIMETHFDGFYKLQKTAFEIIHHHSPKSKLLEEYLTIYPDLNSSFDYNKYKESIQPLVTIAHNNGFGYLL